MNSIDDLKSSIATTEKTTMHGLRRGLVAGLFAGASALPLLALNTTSAAAQDASDDSDEEVILFLEEIVVSATKTGMTGVQSTPIAINAFSGIDLQDRGVADILDLQEHVPAMNIANNSSGMQVFLRGVGTNLIFAANDPSTTINLDGVYIGRPLGSLFEFTDVERIEVLRGPQGTVWGRNAVGGVINVISYLPDNESRGRVNVSYGNYNAVQANAFLSGPLVEDKLAASFAARYAKHDGFIENVVPGGEDIQAIDHLSFKGTLRYTPSADLEFILRSDYTNINDDWGTYSNLLEPAFQPIGLPAPLANSTVGDLRRGAADGDNNIKSDQFGLSLEINYDANDQVSIKSLSAYRRTDHSLEIDFDATEVPFGYSSPVTTTADQYSQEFNLNYTSDRDRAVFGAFIFQENNEEIFNIIIFGDDAMKNGTASGSPFFSAEVETTSLAAFAQWTHDFSSVFSATVGMRYTRDEKDLRGFGIAGGAAYDYTDQFNDEEFTPRFVLNYQPSDDLMVYASVSQGYKSGGFSTTSPVPDSYASESLWAYELGMKTDLMDKRVRLNMAAYYYDYDNLQIQRFVNTNVEVDNAPSTEIYGIEAELNAAITQEFTIGLNVALTSAKYTDFREGFDVATGLTFDATGNRPNNTPGFSGAAFAEYRTQMSDDYEFFFRADASMQSRMFFTQNNESLLSQDSYGLLNLASGFTHSSGWSIQLFAKNLTDTQYITSAARFIAAGFQAQGFAGPPRTYGIRLGYDF